MLPGINDKYTGKKKRKDHLHSQFGPMSTFAIMLRFVIWIGPDLVDQSDHAVINRALVDAFKLAVNEHSRGVSLQTVPHLRNNKYNK
jgi:hypothetical protein